MLQFDKIITIVPAAERPAVIYSWYTPDSVDYNAVFYSLNPNLLF